MSQSVCPGSSNHTLVPASGDPDRFDAQACSFDLRAGLSSDAARAVAEGVLELAGPGGDDLLVELGAGTGQIGQHLAEAVNYVGIDSSARMLDVFRGRLGAVDRSRTRLSHADANQTWPLADGSVAVVFASRVAHLLQTCHLVAELERVCRAGGYFVVGWVVRDSDGAKSRLRQQRRLLLQQRGFARRDREPVIKRALDGLLAAGATQVEARPAARWTASASVQEILTSWETVGAMGGRQIDADTRARLLDELRSWAIRELGDVSALATWEERYMLEGVCLPASPCAQ